MFRYGPADTNSAAGCLRMAPDMRIGNRMGADRTADGGVMYSTPRLLQGIFPFTGQGLARPALLSDALSYCVPADRRAQLVYFRAGNAAPELICATLLRNGSPMRLFPVGAKSDCHVSLAVIEDLLPETRLELVVSAPEGISGELVVDIGLVEMPDDLR